METALWRAIWEYPAKGHDVLSLLTSSSLPKDNSEKRTHRYKEAGRWAFTAVWFAIATKET